MVWVASTAWSPRRANSLSSTSKLRLGAGDSLAMLRKFHRELRSRSNPGQMLPATALFRERAQNVGATKPLTPLRAFECLLGSNLCPIMANTKSAIKAARKTVRLTDRNRGTKTRLKTLRKRLDTLIAAKDEAGVKTAASAYVSAMDKAVKSGVVHRNAVSRAKAHTSKYLFAGKPAGAS